MAAPSASHMVGRCFVATETGTYFEGTGFVKAGQNFRIEACVAVIGFQRTRRSEPGLSSSCLFAVANYRVGLDVSIGLEFRTSRTNGVLLAVSNQASDGLGLEIVNGKVGNPLCEEKKMVDVFVTQFTGC